MNTFVKYPQRQDCHFKLSSGNSGETSINLSTEIAIYLNGGSGMTQGEESSVSFIIYKEDFIKAVCHIFEKLPLYKTSSTSSTKVEFSNSLFLNYTESINSFFGNEESKIYTITLSAVSAPRYYLKNLNYNGFNIRKFLVENNSTLQFSKSEEGFVLRLLSGEVKLEGDELVFKNTPTLILKNSVLKNFILDTLIYFQKYEALENLAPYASASSPIKISSSNHGFALTGMFLDSTLEDVQSRNKGHIRWFEEPLFSINGKNVFLSTQWNSKGNYQLTLPDFKKLIEVCFEDKYRISVDSEGFFELWKNDSKSIFAIDIFADSPYRTYLTALRTKPFLLLAGISGTGKSRIVKEMAFACCPDVAGLRNDPVSPGNYLLVEVKPNWHDSTELLGYESTIKKGYVLTPFVKFLYKAMKHPDVPFFVCLDEMNLAPVEQYFAEFLSILESRKQQADGTILTEPLISAEVFRKYPELCAEMNGTAVRRENVKNTYMTTDPAVEYVVTEREYENLCEEGLRIPQNVVVIGTVNMDETTHQFSRKVIDRAMTIEMNEVKFDGFFESSSELTYPDRVLPKEYFLPCHTTAGKALESVPDDAEYIKANVPAMLEQLNEALADTPFKIAYRVQNELVLYFAALRQEEAHKATGTAELLATAMDQILMMKVLPRIEGDDELLEKPLERLAVYAEGYPKASAKIKEMQERLGRSHFTSFWP